MLNSNVEKSRKALSSKLKLCREVYGISFTDLQRTSGLSPETVCRIEAGVKSWSVDSQILYVTTLISLITKVKRDKPAHFGQNSFPEINLFLREHQYTA